MVRRRWVPKGSTQITCKCPSSRPLPRERLMKNSKVLKNYVLPYILTSHKTCSGGSATHCIPLPATRDFPQRGQQVLAPPPGELSPQATEGVHFQMHVFVQLYDYKGLFQQPLFGKELPNGVGLADGHCWKCHRRTLYLFPSIFYRLTATPSTTPCGHTYAVPPLEVELSWPLTAGS